MKKYILKGLAAITLSFCLVIGGCAVPAWVGEVGTIVAALAPAVINILQIVAIAEGKPVNAALEAKVTADAGNIKVLANAFATASAAAAPNACAQLQAGLTTFGTDEQQVFSLIQVSDPATQQKAMLLYNLVQGAFGTITALIPSCQSPVALRESLAKAALPTVSGNQFVTNYNSALVVPTGHAAVDAYTKAHKIHAHSKFVRVVSLGFEK